jgi:purine-binding chemotaxis protein CheW
MTKENLMSEQQQVATFVLDRHLFGVRVERVREVLRSQQMTHVPLAPDVVAGLINLRGEIVTALDGRRRLGLPERSKERAPMSVVLRSNDGAVSLLVDEIGDVLDVDTACFEPPPETLPQAFRELIPGAYKLEQGLLLELDVDRVLAVETHA